MKKIHSSVRGNLWLQKKGSCLAHIALQLQPHLSVLNDLVAKGMNGDASVHVRLLIHSMMDE